MRYGEGLLVGYRGYDYTGREVAYPFGHGLSYTAFDYARPVVNLAGNDLSVAVNVTNVGERAGREVVQVYVGVVNSQVMRAPRELKGFAGVTLEPGETRTVTIEIPAEELAYWSVADQRWIVEAGDYQIWVGSSSRDLRASLTVQLPGDEPRRPITMETTMTEAVRHPMLTGRIDELVVEGFGPAATDDSLGVTLAELFAEMPLASLVGFAGEDPAELQALIDRANAAG